jgi:hypothetical protein
MSDKDVDAQFADIVAHWDDVPSLPDRAPTAGKLDDAAGPEGGEPAEPYAGGPRPGVNPPLRPSPDPTNPPPVRPFVVWRGADPAQDSPHGVDDAPAPAELADVDDDEHFVPGPTAPLPPQEDIQFWGIVVGLVAGPLLLLWLVLFRPAVSGWWTLAALGLTVGGFVLLVLRQPHSRDDDSPDNGARV